MKRASIALTALVLLAVTGCAGTTEPAADEAQETPQSHASETPEPLVAETPAESNTDDAEALFIEKFHEIRATMPGDTFIPNATDDQLIAAGEEACARLDAGESSESIVLIEGEEKNGAGYYSDSSALMVAARESICPEG